MTAEELRAQPPSPELRQRLRRFAPFVLLALLCAGLIAHAAHYWPFLSDDALISLRYARRLAQGLGLTWTGSERVEGYTDFLWVLLAAAGSAVGFDPIAFARALDVAGALAAVGLVSCTPRPFALHPVRLLTGGLSLTMSAPLAVWAVGGLEHGFMAGVLAGALVMTLRVLSSERTKSWEIVAAGGLWGALALLRADGIVLGLGAACGVALAGGLRLRSLARAGSLLALPALFLGLQLLFRYGYYGALVPNTALAKVSFSVERVLGGFRHVRDGYTPLLPVLGLTAVGLGLGGWRVRRTEWIVPLAVVFAWSSYLGLVGGDIFPGWRQLLLAIVPLAFVLAERAQAVAERFSRGTEIALGVSVPVLALGLFLQHRDPENRRAKAERWEWDGHSIGHLLRRAFGAKQPLLAIDAAGALPYWSELPSLDMLGLNDRYIALHPPPDFGRGGIGHELGDGAYVLRRKPDIVAFNNAAGARDPMFLSGRQMLRTKEFREGYQLIRARGQRGVRAVGELWIRRDGVVGVVSTAERIEIPGYLISGHEVLAELDAEGRLVSRVGSSLPAEMPPLAVPGGSFRLVLDTDVEPGALGFRCDRVSAARTGAPGTVVALPRTAELEIVVGSRDESGLALRSARLERSDEEPAFRCALPNARLVVPLAQLATRKLPNAYWALPDNAVFGKAGLRVELPTPLHSAAIEVSVDGNDLYTFSFWRGARLLGEVDVEPADKGIGLALQRVLVPALARRLGFDRLEVDANGGDRAYSVGHVVLVD